MKFVSLLSSGIDSPVATYLLSRRDEDIILIHTDGRPFTDDRDIEIFLLLARRIKTYVSGKLSAYLVPHGKSLTTIIQKCNPRYTCVLCKRMLVRYAEMFVKNKHADAIIMGDSLGQVASQTLQNLRVVEAAVTTPILRPLIGLDKQEIVEIAKNIGTYSISILSSAGCLAVPAKPTTRARVDSIIAEEKKIHIDKLVNQAINNSKLLPF